MATPLYPGVTIQEIDASVTIDSAISSLPAFVIRAQKGPINVPTLIANEKDLVDIFGEPFSGDVASGVSFNNLKDWFSVSNFLSYVNGAYVVRAEVSDGAAAYNAAIEAGASVVTKNLIQVFDGTDFTDVSEFTASRLGVFAKNPGYWGNDLSVGIYVAGVTDTLDNKGESGSAWNTWKENVGQEYADFKTFDNFPIDGEAAVIVYVDNVVTERFIVSLDTNGKAEDGSNNYIDDVLKGQSKYVSSYANASFDTISLASFTKTALAYGAIVTGSLDDGDVTAALDLFSNPDEYQIDFIVDGGFNTKTVQEKCSSISASRKDCLAIIGARTEDISNKTVSAATKAVIAYKKTLSISGDAATYCAFFGNIKKMYNKYADKYFWLSCSSDAAGLFAVTDIKLWPWYATAGASRGVLRNVTALGFNPDDTYVGQMYQTNINTIKFISGVGNAINGNRTMQAKPSAFRDINVRRLFTYCEQAILDTSKFYLFEFNDALTRSNLETTVVNFMNTVKANRGVYNFMVVCDETNNTSDVIDNNELYLDVLIKPSRAIDNITVRFTVTRTDTDFTEI